MALKQVVCLLVVNVIVAVGVCIAQTNWPGWRGPDGNGSSTAAGLPTRLDPNTALWSLNLPGPAASTPALWNGKIFLTSTVSDNNDLLGLCIDAAKGSIVWKRKLSSSREQFPRNNSASPSPVVDAERVYFMFGNGVLIGCDHDGNPLWQRDLAADYGPLSLKFGFSSSPLLMDKTLYIAVLRRQTVYQTQKNKTPLISYLLAVDSATGKTIFYQQRPTGALDETTNSYISPIAAAVDGTSCIALFAADCITLHDFKAGHEQFRYQYDTSKDEIGRNISTPIADGKMLYAVFPRATAVAAFDLSDRNSTTRWRIEKTGSDASTPALYKGYLYMVEDRSKNMVCVDTRDGQTKWRGPLDSSAMFYASVTAADDKIYVVNEAGVVNVVAADPNEFRLLSTSRLGQPPVLSTPAVVDEHIYLRTAKTLYGFRNH
jgi:outer membrane protein assembly factor BamB